MPFLQMDRLPLFSSLNCSGHFMLTKGIFTTQTSNYGTQKKDELTILASEITVQEGEGGAKWSQAVGEMPPNVQEIIARGGLEKWVKAEIGL